MLTALIIFAGTLAGIWWPTKEDRDEFAEQASDLDGQVGELTVELDNQQQVNVELQDQVDARDSTITSLQEQLDQTNSPTSDEDETTPPAGEVDAVYRETLEPLRFNEGYGVDLDTLDDDWGIGQIFGSLDLYLDSSSEGLRLSTPPGVVAVMDGAVSYDDCNRATDLQDTLSTEETVVGRQFCLKTNGRRWAFVTIVEVDRVREAIAVDATIWAQED
jgi:hypothetical protein